jgi:hypothetical protein
VGTFYLQRFLPGVPLWQAVALTVAANIAGQLGDLVESAMKRGANVKDSGGVLPGHGGFLDRVDSTLFALPVVYAYLGYSVIRAAIRENFSPHRFTPSVRTATLLTQRVHSAMVARHLHLTVP